MNIGWDIGIKNLSYCLTDKNNKIIEWDIINLTENDVYYCSKVQKNQKICKRKASRIDPLTSIMYCKTHSKNENTIEMFVCFTCGKKAKKKKGNSFYCKKHSDDTMKDIELPKKNLNFLGNTLVEKMDQNSRLIDVENIYIENQPVLKNPTMKTIQIILFSYYLIRKKNHNYNIKLVPANSKLKFSIKTDAIEELKNSNKTKYQKNKKLAIEYCRELIKNDIKWVSYFEKYTKKDDLADSFLLNIYNSQS